MAVPTRYNPKRLSDYFGRTNKFKPSVPSGASSGPGRFVMADRGHRYESEKKLLESVIKAQAKHERLMDKLAAKDSATFDRINKALTASREADPKDALGNSIPSEQTQYLQEQLKSHLIRSGIKARNLTPGGPGTKASEYGSSGRLNTPTPQGDTIATPTLRKPPQGQAEPLPVNTVVTHRASGKQITLTGKSRMGPTGPEYMAKTESGVEAWVPRSAFDVPGEESSEATRALERFFAPKYDPNTPYANIIP